VTLQVFTSALLRIPVFWDVMLFRWVSNL